MIIANNISRALCTTSACLDIATEYLNNLSPNYKQIDACTSFEEFVCGGWRDRHQLKANESYISAQSLLVSANTELLRTILEGPYPDTPDHSHFSQSSPSVDRQNFEKMKLLYTTCMDEPAINAAGARPVAEELDKMRTLYKRGGLSEAVEYFWHLQWPALVILYISTFDSAGQQSLVLDPGSWSGLGQRKFYNNTDDLAEYTAILADIFEAVYPARFPGQSSVGLAEAVVAFEVALWAINPQVPSNSTQPTPSNTTSVSAVSKLIPQIVLESMISKFVPAGYTVGDVLVTRPQYFSDLSDLLSKTANETVEGYLAWRLIAGIRNLGSTNLMVFDAFTRLVNRLNGRPLDAPAGVKQPRFTKCVTEVTALGWILSRFFVEAYFSGASKELGDRIIEDLRDSYREQFKLTNWMDDATREKAIQKVEMMVRQIGYPTESPSVIDPASLQDYYSRVNITSHYLQNSLEITRQAAWQSFQDLGKPREKRAWKLPSYVTDAMYTPRTNTISFPAGILQPPYFHAALPSFVNYAGFGAVAGHEIGHGFDNDGSRYDATGALQNWWTNDTAAEYARRTRCFVEQYDNMTLFAPGGNGTGVRVNGTRTLGENIADTSGHLASWAAWQRHRAAASSSDPSLPGLEGFTDEQMFFVALGNVFCSKATQAGLESRNQRTVHAPDAARLGGVVMNSRAFKEAFGCKQKEPVCELW